MQKGFALPILILAIVGISIIGVVGYFLYQNQTKPAPITLPQPSPSLTSVTKESTNSAIMTDWKTYTNAKFTFMYPSNGYVQIDRPDWIEIPNEQNTEPYFIFRIQLKDNPDRLTIKQLVDQRVEEIRNNQYNLSANTQADKTLQTMKEYRNGQINGIKLATFFEGYPTGYGEILMAKDNFVYDFTIHDGSGNVDTLYEKMLDQILSTFKFLP